jgi:hypothetical protein
MRRYWFLFIFICLPFIAAAQSGVISGKVFSGDAKTAVQRASVFLNNATYGTATNDDGSFTLRDIKPGQYDLVVTVVGFEEYSQKVLVGSQPVNLNIQLTPKVMMMKSVTIISNADWKKNYDQFEKEFIGTNDNAKQCKVINPRVLDLIYYRKKQTLEASADEFLVVENRALGYRTKFLLKNFNSNGITHVISYGGKALFEDLPGSEDQIRKWHLKRDEAYYGSPQHFYRALFQNRLADEGFIMYDFTRILNPKRMQEELIQRKLKQFNMVNRDSLNYWLSQQDEPKWAKETLVKPQLTAYDVLRKTPQEGIFAITFPHYLYVTYIKKREETYFKDIYRPLDMPNYETSVITLYSPYAVFDMNGTVIAESPLYEGTWSKAKLANMLPVDYEPYVK